MMKKAIATAPGLATEYVELTEVETEDRQAESAVYEAQIPLNEWKAKMAETDTDMPRWMEDHIESEHDGITKNPYTQGKYNAKKALRAQKPE